MHLNQLPIAYLEVLEIKGYTVQFNKKEQDVMYSKSFLREPIVLNDLKQIWILYYSFWYLRYTL